MLALGSHPDYNESKGGGLGLTHMGSTRAKFWLRFMRVSHICTKYLELMDLF